MISYFNNTDNPSYTTNTKYILESFFYEWESLIRHRSVSYWKSLIGWDASARFFIGSVQKGSHLSVTVAQGSHSFENDSIIGTYNCYWLKANAIFTTSTIIIFDAHAFTMSTAIT